MGSDGVGGGENGAVFGAADDNEIGGSDGLADGADGEEANISGSDDKGLLNSLTDTILSKKLDLLRAKFAAKAGNNEVSGAGAPNAVGADDGASDDTSVTGDADADNADVVNVAVADGGANADDADGTGTGADGASGADEDAVTDTGTDGGAGNGDDGDSTESTDEKGLLSSLTDSILRAKLELLKAPLAVKTGALSLAANAINGLASFGSGESGNDVVSGGVTTDGSNAVGADNGAVADDADDAADASDDADVADVADGAGGAGDADTDNTNGAGTGADGASGANTDNDADSGDGDEVSADSSDGNILESIIKAKLAVVGAAANAAGAVANIVADSVVANIDTAVDVLGAGAQLGANPTADLAGAILGATADIAGTSVEVIGSNIDKLSDITDETLEAKLALAKAGVKTAAIGAEGALNLTQSVV